MSLYGTSFWDDKSEINLKLISDPEWKSKISFLKFFIIAPINSSNHQKSTINLSLLSQSFLNATWNFIEDAFVVNSGSSCKNSSSVRVLNVGSISVMFASNVSQNSAVSFEDRFRTASVPFLASWRCEDITMSLALEELEHLGEIRGKDVSFSLGWRFLIWAWT